MSLIEPQDYLSFVFLMSRANSIFTVLGGVQEVAPRWESRRVLCVTQQLPTAVEAGTLKLFGTQTDVIVQEACQLLEDRSAYQAMSFGHNPYGDGMGAALLVDVIQKFVIANISGAANGE